MSVHRGVPGPGGVPGPRVGCLVLGVPGPGGVPGGGVWSQWVPGPRGVPGGDPPGQLLLRAVRILLECILVELKMKPVHRRNLSALV